MGRSRHRRRHWPRQRSPRCCSGETSADGDRHPTPFASVQRMPDRRGHGKGRAAKATRWWRGSTFSLDRFDRTRGRPRTGTKGVFLDVSSPLRGAGERGLGVLLRRGAARAHVGQRPRSVLRGPCAGVRTGAGDAVVPPPGRVTVVGMRRRYRCPDDDTGSKRRSIDSACRGRRAFARRVEGASPPHPSLRPRRSPGPPNRLPRGSVRRSVPQPAATATARRPRCGPLCRRPRWSRSTTEEDRGDPGWGSPRFSTSTA